MAGSSARSLAAGLRRALVGVLLGWLLLGIGPAWPAEPPEMPDPALTDGERFAWRRMLEGRVADFADPEACGTALVSWDDDPRWYAECRRIRADFLERVLTQAPWRPALHFRGLRLRGARIVGPLDLEAARLEPAIILENCLFEAAVGLAGAHFERDVALNGSTFRHGIFASGAVFGGNFQLRGGALRSDGTPTGGDLSLGGVKVEGWVELSDSIFEGAIAAESLTAGLGVFMRNAVVSGPLALINARPGRQLALGGSILQGGIDAAYLQVAGDVFLDAGLLVTGRPLTLASAKVDGSVWLDAATFATGINAENASIGGDLRLRRGTVVDGSGLQRRDDGVADGGVINLRSSRIGGTLDLDAVLVADGISAEALQLGQSLLVRNGSVVGRTIDLLTARIGVTLNVTDAAIQMLNAEAVTIGTYLIFSDAAFLLPPNLFGARIGFGVALANAALPGLDLSASSIGAELRLATRDVLPPVWVGAAAQPDPAPGACVAARPAPGLPAEPRNTAGLNLRNARIGALQDWDDPRHGDPWPHRLDLQGLTYERLGGAADPGVAGMRSRPEQWYVGWLARDPVFTRQPYQQLAATFRAAGDPDRADAVLIAARDREKAEDWRCHRVLSAMGLTMLQWTTNYGLGGGYWWAVMWVFLITGIGMLVLRRVDDARDRSVLWRFGASLDQLLPIIELSPEFSEFFKDTRRLGPGAQIWFAVQSILGYVLGGFVAAGLAGLTQAQ